VDYFYILECADGTYYSGVTNDLDKRSALHNSGKGSVYVRSHGGGRVVYSEKYKNRGEALRREIEVKKWPRRKKRALILGY
jgi:putative endonuclease